MARDVVGGVFGLELAARPTSPPFDRDAVAFVNARSALRWVLKRRKPETLWLPSYLCDALVTAAAGVCKTAFYPVGERLQVDDASWIASLSERDAVLFIDYFGFREWLPIAAEVLRRGAWIIEDAAQALYLTRAREAGCIIHSPRKFVGVADGGLLSGMAEAPDSLAEPPAEWWLEAFRAVLLRAESDRDGRARDWFQHFQESERLAPAGDYRMSDVSKAQLFHGIDYEDVRRRRIDNYDALAQSLGDLALFPVRGDAVPLGFPVRLRRRDTVRDALFAAGIYPATHWPAADHPLADSILTLPCDQRYDRSTMSRIVDVVREAMR